MTIFFLLIAVQPAFGRIIDIDSYFNEIETRINTKLENADSGISQVSNNIKLEANTGGNTAASGEVVNGEATSKATIKTVVNGEVVENKTIEEESSTGNVDIEIEANIEVNGQDEPKIEISTKVNDEVLGVDEIKLEDTELKSVDQVSQILAEENQEENMPETTNADSSETLPKEDVMIDEKDNNEVDIQKNEIIENNNDCTIEEGMCPLEPIADTPEAVDRAVLDWIQEFIEMLKNKLKAILATLK